MLSFLSDQGRRSRAGNEVEAVSFPTVWIMCQWTVTVGLNVCLYFHLHLTDIVAESASVEVTVGPVDKFEAYACAWDVVLVVIMTCCEIARGQIRVAFCVGEVGLLTLVEGC